MSRRGNCYDNAVAESFFQLRKRERIKRKSTLTGKKRDGMSFISSSCSTNRNAVMVASALSPVEFEKQHFIRQQSVY